MACKNADNRLLNITLKAIYKSVYVLIRKVNICIGKKATRKYSKVVISGW